MTGNTKRATALRMKIVASDSEVWFSSASITGATAAMALPPQIAGVNLETPKPIQEALDVFGEVLDEIEALLAE